MNRVKEFDRGSKNLRCLLRERSGRKKRNEEELNYHGPGKRKDNKEGKPSLRLRTYFRFLSLFSGSDLERKVTTYRVAESL